MMREVDLLLYLPHIMKRYYEIQKIMSAENPEFQLLWEADELIRLNLYIITAREEGLRRYEKILGIYPDPNDSFETRRIRIIARWNDCTPYTYRYLIGLLTVLTDGNFEINTNFSEYEIEIIISVRDGGIVQELDYIIREIIPCNLTVISINEFECSATGSVSIKAAFNYTTLLFITNDFDKTISVESSAKIGSTSVVVTEYKI